MMWSLWPQNSQPPKKEDDGSLIDCQAKKERICLPHILSSLFPHAVLTG